jgi:radical SAM protein with 4Fe4S-binding SPASM domain
MAVEPDGSVLPCQSYYESLGNILKDPWDGIWDHDLCRRIRERKYLPEDCRDCELSDVCGGGCPLSLEGGHYVCLDKNSSI